MVALPEEDTFPTEIRRIETTDPVLGGPPNEATGAGLSNIAPMQLAKRTRWLKTRVDALLASVVAASTTTAGIVRLSTSTTSNSDTEAATPSAVKAAMDNGNIRAPAARRVEGGGLATGGGDLSADRVITVPPANQAEAEAGVLDSKAMTPLSVKWAVTALIGSVASAAGFAVLLAANGYIRFPTWLGGWMVQWGSATQGASLQVPITFPLTFPNACRAVTAQHIGTGGAMVIEVFGARTATATTLKVFNDQGLIQSGWLLSWMAIGN